MLLTRKRVTSTFRCVQVGEQTIKNTAQGGDMATILVSQSSQQQPLNCRDAQSAGGVAACCCFCCRCCRCPSLPSRHH
jgi:hypothetical protein